MESPRGELLDHLHRATRAALFHEHFRADAGRIGSGPLQLDPQVVVLAEFARAVAIDRDGGVDPVHDQIQCSRIVQVHIRGAIGKPRMCEPPLPSLVRERQVPVVAVRVVGDRDLRHFRDECMAQPRHAVPQ